MSDRKQMKREMGKLAKEMRRSLEKGDLRGYRRLKRRYYKLESKQRRKKAGRRNR